MIYIVCMYAIWMQFCHLTFRHWRCLTGPHVWHKVVHKLFCRLLDEAHSIWSWSSFSLCSAVPPSTPSCRIQGPLDVGSDVMLLCGSDEGIPTPTYAWEKLESVPKLPHNAMQGTKPLPVGIPFCPTFSGKCSVLDSCCGVTSDPPPVHRVCLWGDLTRSLRTA